MDDELTLSLVHAWLYLSLLMIVIGLAYISLEYLNKYLEKRYKERLRRLNGQR